MKLPFKVLVALLVILFGFYHLAFFIMPSVTIHNEFGHVIESAKVELPNNSLDFGSIEAGSSNTIHYQLAQADGVYEYQFIFVDETKLTGSCGYITNNEMNKRVVIELTADAQVICREPI